MALVAELLDNLNMKHTLGVFQAEAQVHGVNRIDLGRTLQIKEEDTSADKPLLINVLAERTLN